MSKDIRRTAGVSLYLNDQSPTLEVINYWSKQLGVPAHAIVHMDDTEYLEFSWME